MYTQPTILLNRRAYDNQHERQSFNSQSFYSDVNRIVNEYLDGKFYTYISSPTIELKEKRTSRKVLKTARLEILKDEEGKVLDIVLTQEILDSLLENMFTEEQQKAYMNKKREIKEKYQKEMQEFRKMQTDIYFDKLREEAIQKGCDEGAYIDSVLRVQRIEKIWFGR